MEYASLDKECLIKIFNDVKKEYEYFKNKNLSLDISRGKPGADQLNLLNDFYNLLNKDNVVSLSKIDARNYGNLDGLPEAKDLFSKILDVKPSQIIIGGNSSLNLMYDSIARAMTHGVLHSSKPWGKYEKIKFLCPSPGYDRHFAITEFFGIEMITIPMLNDGPDMDMIENLVSKDETIKGIWCVPKYSNPEGIVYSDKVVKRFASLKPKAKDFRIFWDNAYAIHGFTEESKNDKILNIIEECEKAGNPDMVFEYFSTSKITFPGSGVSVLASSEANINFTLSQLGFQIISYDKMNQLRHVIYFKNKDGILKVMDKHAKVLKPKFDTVLSAFNKNLKGLGIADWLTPNGGYFVSLNVLSGCAKRVVSLAKEAGLVLTPAGSTYPYKNDPNDSNIRIAPSYPSVDELKQAMDLLCICVKLGCLEKIINNK